MNLFSGLIRDKKKQKYNYVQWNILNQICKKYNIYEWMFKHRTLCLLWLVPECPLGRRGALYMCRLWRAREIAPPGPPERQKGPYAWTLVGSLGPGPSCGLVRPVRPNIFWPKRCGGDGPRPVRPVRPVRRVRPNIICIIWSKKYDGDRSARSARSAWSAQIYFGPKGPI